MRDSRLRPIASIGLVVGAVLGMAGTLVSSASVRGLALRVGWDCELIIAGALLTVDHFRLGNDLAAAGFLVFDAGQTLILSMDLAGSTSLFGAGVGFGGFISDCQRI